MRTREFGHLIIGGEFERTTFEPLTAAGGHRPRAPWRVEVR